MPPLGGVGSQFTNFTYASGIRPEEISPCSSNSSDNESETSASPPQSPVSDVPGFRTRLPPITAASVAVKAEFEIEECSDVDEDDEEDMDSGHEDVLRPYGFESPVSDRSRSRSRSDKEVDPQLMNSMEDLDTCFQSDSSSDSDEDSKADGDYAEYLKEMRNSRQQRRVRRMTSGSISKRTVSERGSDSDREDLQPWDTGDDNQRRLRRKVNRNRNRHSLLSIPPDIIIELKEPNSDGEVVWDEDEQHAINLARELPFWHMEVDSD